MEKIIDLPFYSNTPDDTHCFQAGLKMILKYFLPEKDFSFEELEKISAKKEGLWTWPMAALIWMQENGFEVVNIEVFDYARFIKDGEKYLLKVYGKEAGEAQIKHSDISQEIEFSKLFLKEVATQNKIPVKQDVINLMLDGYVVAANLNSVALDEESGYVGHFVVIKGFDDENFILNDPGLPGMENRKVSYKVFEKAWAYPDEKSKNIMAFRLKD